MKEIHEYYLGLDMGTNSVGWAVTDPEYNLLRAKGKDLWGIREFEEAKTAAERRGQRTSRRRIQRQKARVALLREYFADEIDKVDPDFYARMDNSFYQLEDKDSRLDYTQNLFHDAGFTDKELHEKYPTIFHLIMDLINNPEPHDVRLVYLAVLNIFKHRGHFLNMGMTKDSSKVDLNWVYGQLVGLLSEKTDLTFPETMDVQGFEDIMCDKGLSKSKKAEKVNALLGIDVKTKDKEAKACEKRKAEIIKAICGLKADAKNIFGDEFEDKITIEFSKSDYNEKIDELEAALGEDYSEVVGVMKQIYDTCIWDAVISGYEYLSEARVASYEKHKKDLLLLKQVIREFKNDEYNYFFKTEEVGTYGDYVGSNNSDGKKHRRGSKDSKHKRDDFYAGVKKLIGKIEDSRVEQILTEIENNTFMPKQLTGENGVIPYQAHYKELKKILTNAEFYFPFLKETNPEANNLSVTEQILQVFEFRIPYYIGPTSENSAKNGGNGWVIRKESGPVRPWNYKEKINVEATSEKFIQRLVRRCTYLSEEPVLPKASLLYEKFALLNELNSLAIDGERIDTELKQRLYNELFLKGKTVTKKGLAKKLLSYGKIESESQISGIDIRFNNSLANHKKFADILGRDIVTDSDKKLAEDVVYWCTVFGESKNMLKDKLTKNHGDVLSKEQIKRISGMKFSDWGKLSKEFLCLEGCDKETGELVTIIDAMWENQLNLMELINSNRFTFKEVLEEKNKKEIGSLESIKVEDLDEYYFSAPVKRMVWQTILVIKELESILGKAPSRVFVEMTRSEGEKGKRTDSRKQKFLNLYKAAGEDMKVWEKKITDAEKDGSIKSKKFYLYLLQKGRDLYTGQPINIDELFDNNIYDIDHIYPQSKVKDDNLDNNMALVKKTVNNLKQDVYPLEESIRKRCYGFWKELHEQGFMNDEKFKRLTSSHGFTEDQLAGFIARQLVETSQGTKAVAEILKQILPKDSKLIYSKARVVSEFRHKFTIPKSRLLNDFHHANDAYLNIVVGNSYYVKFTNNPFNFIKNEYKTDKNKYSYNLAKFFERDVVRNGETAWIGCGKQREDGEYEEKGTIVTVKNVIKRQTPLMTRRTFEAHGGISDQTLYSASVAGAGKGYLPTKANDPRLSVEKYGGFKNASTAYFFLVESGSEGKRVRTLETVPIYLSDRIKKNSDELMKYCIETLGLINPDIRIDKIRIQSLVERNGYRIQITGKTGNQISLRNATNLYLTGKWISYIKKIEKFSNTQNLDCEISKDENIHLYNNITDKLLNKPYSCRPNPIGEKLINKKEEFSNLDLATQTTTLNEILKMLTIGPAGKGNLVSLGESVSTGVMLIPKKIDSKNDLKLIYQSVTGVYEKSIDLLKV